MNRLGIGLQIDGICETDEAKKTVRQTRVSLAKLRRWEVQSYKLSEQS